ncbi:unnamed protein product, partial [Ixodes pacificus]
CQSLCINTEGGYRCRCSIRFKLGYVYIVCVHCLDIDECHASNGGCQEGCVNLIGSFRCKCTSAGSSLAADRKSCVCKYRNVNV